MTIHLFNKEVTMLIVRYDKLSIHSAMRKKYQTKTTLHLQFISLFNNCLPCFNTHLGKLLSYIIFISNRPAVDLWTYCYC